jgi:hypothetical protein
LEDLLVTARATCGYCDYGFRRVAGIHIGSQRLGMIPDAPCESVFAVQIAATLADRPWIVHVDGEPLLRKRDGEVRRFATATAAVNAGRKAAPRRWHP